MGRTSMCAHVEKRGTHTLHRNKLSMYTKHVLNAVTEPVVGAKHPTFQKPIHQPNPLGPKPILPFCVWSAMRMSFFINLLQLSSDCSLACRPPRPPRSRHFFSGLWACCAMTITSMRLSNASKKSPRQTNRRPRFFTFTTDTASLRTTSKARFKLPT